MNAKAQLWAWCTNTLPRLRGCGPATQKSVKESLVECGLVESCIHLHASRVTSDDGKRILYQCDNCGEFVS